MTTFKPNVSRFLYPLVRKAAKGGTYGMIATHDTRTEPIIPFHEQQATLHNGRQIDFSTYAGKKVLIVNTASNCGYTGQYAELQKLHERFSDKLFIIAFPANDFREQEESNDDEIAKFCQVNYGVTFPIAKKGVVIKCEEQLPIYKWLTNSEANGWNDHQPDWNFGKYLIDEKGILTKYFGPSISPLDNEFVTSGE